jgi:hypothetical protein
MRLCLITHAYNRQVGNTRPSSSLRQRSGAKWPKRPCLSSAEPADAELVLRKVKLATLALAPRTLVVY